MIRIAPVTARVTKPFAVTKSVTFEPVTVTVAVTHCPACGHKLKAHQTKAAKQKAYRERKRAQA